MIKLGIAVLGYIHSRRQNTLLIKKEITVVSADGVRIRDVTVSDGRIIFYNLVSPKRKAVHFMADKKIGLRTYLYK